MDAEGTGSVPVSEFKISLETVGIDPSSERVQRMMKQSIEPSIAAALPSSSASPSSLSLSSSSSTRSNVDYVKFLALVDSASELEDTSIRRPVAKHNIESVEERVPGKPRRHGSATPLSSPNPLNDETPVVFRPSRRLVDVEGYAAESCEERDVFQGAHRRKIPQSQSSTLEGDDHVIRTSGKRGVVRANYFKFLDSEDSPWNVPDAIHEDMEIRKVREIVASKLDYSKANISNLFREFDENGDGVISVDEFRNGLQSLGVHLPEDRFQVLVKKTDRDGDGEIDFGEFVQVMKYHGGSGGEISEDPFAKQASSLKRQASIRIMQRESSMKDIIQGKPVEELANGSDADYGTNDNDSAAPSGTSGASVVRRGPVSKTFATSTSDVQDRKELEASVRRDRRLRDKICKAIFEKNPGTSIRDLFRAFDADKNGLIDHEEFRRGLKSAGVDLTINEFERLVHNVGKQERDGEISYTEFASLMGLDEVPAGATLNAGDTSEDAVSNGYRGVKHFGNTPDHMQSSIYEHQEVQRLTPAQRHGIVLRKKLTEKLDALGKTATEVFLELDADRSGLLSAEEITSGFGKYGLKLSHEDVDQIVERCDPEGSGKITVSDIAAYLALETAGPATGTNPSKLQRSLSNMHRISKESSEVQKERGLFNQIRQKFSERSTSARRLFMDLDINHDGELSREEFADGLLRQGLNLSSAEIDFVYRRCDADQSGTVDLSEFQRVFDGVVSGESAKSSTVNAAGGSVDYSRVPLQMRSHFDNGGWTSEMATPMVQSRHVDTRLFEKRMFGDDDDAASSVDMSSDHGGPGGDDSHSVVSQESRSTGSNTFHQFLQQPLSSGDASLPSSFAFKPRSSFNPDVNSEDASHGSNSQHNNSNSNSNINDSISSSSGGLNMSTSGSRPAVSWNEPAGRALRSSLLDLHSAAQIRETFRIFDRNRNGKIARTDFEAAVRSLLHSATGLTDRKSKTDNLLVERATQAFSEGREGVVVDYSKFMHALDLSKQLFEDSASFQSGANEKPIIDAHRTTTANSIIAHEEFAAPSEQVRALVSPMKPRRGHDDHFDMLHFPSERSEVDSNQSPKPQRTGRRMVTAPRQDSLLGTTFKELPSNSSSPPPPLPPPTHSRSNAQASPSQSLGVLPLAPEQVPRSSIRVYHSSSPSPSASASAPRNGTESPRPTTGTAGQQSAVGEQKLFAAKRRAPIPDSGDLSVNLVRGTKRVSTATSEPESSRKLFLSKKRVVDAPQESISLEFAENTPREPDRGSSLSSSSAMQKQPEKTRKIDDLIRQKVYQNSSSPRQAFNRVISDPRKDRVSVEDLQLALRNMNLEVSAAQVRRVVREANRGRASEGLTYEQFCNGFLEPTTTTTRGAGSPATETGEKSHVMRSPNVSRQAAFSAQNHGNILAHHSGPADQAEKTVEPLRPVGPYHSPHSRGTVYSSPSARARGSPRSSGDIIAWRE
eukprot:ANDGO_04391.mRNA.1 Calmodulin-like protein